MSKKEETRKELEENYPEVKTWLAKLQKKENNAYNLKRFCEWAKLDPRQLLALKANPASKDAERLLDTFVSDEKTGFTNSVKFTMVTSVKSFFKANYADIAHASGAMTLEKVKDYNKLAKENLRKLWNWTRNQRDKALITFVCSTAIAKETLVNLKWKHLEEGWETKELPCLDIPSELLKGHGHGRYKGVKQITFLTGEAKRDLINYKEWMEQRLGRKLTSEDHIWRSTAEPYGPLGYGRLGTLIYNLSKDSGVPFSWHDARRFVNTALEQIGISSNWARKIRGRKVKGEEAPYSQPAIEQLRAKFAEAVSLLQFTGIEKESVGVKEAALEFSLNQLKALGASEEECERLRESVLRGEATIEDAARKVEETRAVTFKAIVIRKEKEKPAKDDCADGRHCQRIVTEEDLGPALAEHWRVVATLPSGKIVIER